MPRHPSYNVSCHRLDTRTLRAGGLASPLGDRHTYLDFLLSVNLSLLNYLFCS